MTDPNIVQALEEFAREQGSVVTGALIVSQIIDPDTDIDWCQAQLAELAQFMPTDAGAVDVVHILQEQGFHGSDAYYKSENSALAHVLESREGIPISLAVVILGVCEQLNVQATGINFPTHFLVSVADTHGPRQRYAAGTGDIGRRQTACLNLEIQKLGKTDWTIVKQLLRVVDIVGHCLKFWPQ